jgi:hypothetical protein
MKRGHCFIKGQLWLYAPASVSHAELMLLGITRTAVSSSVGRRDRHTKRFLSKKKKEKRRRRKKWSSRKLRPEQS